MPGFETDIDGEQFADSPALLPKTLMALTASLAFRLVLHKLSLASLNPIVTNRLPALIVPPPPPPSSSSSSAMPSNGSGSSSGDKEIQRISLGSNRISPTTRDPPVLALAGSNAEAEGEEGVEI
jgi:hypothetical protein